MKTFRYILIILLLASGMIAGNEAKAQPGVSVSVDFNTFYNDLSPYGRWVDHPAYGRVWVYDEPGFRPYYSRGHWDYTDYGWTWVSDYDWGWAPFHYGRWEEDPELGWLWIPGYEWAPAWVTWSQYDDYYGWAPLGYGLDIDISIGRVPYDRWVFMPREYINSPRFYDYCIPFDHNRMYYRNATVIHNFYDRGGRRFMMGPDRYEVERITHGRVEPRSIGYNQRYGFPPQGRYDRDDTYRRNNDFPQRRDDGRIEDRRIDNRNDNNGWQKERQQSRGQIFGGQGQAQNNGRWGGSYPQQRREVNNGNFPQQNNYPQQSPEQAPPQRNYGQNNNQIQRQRTYNNPGDQRNYDRQESRGRIFGNEQRGNERQNNQGSNEREGRWGRRG